MNGIYSLFIEKTQEVLTLIINKLPNGIKKATYAGTLIFLSSCILFTRSFAGIYLFGLRLGEILVGISLVMSFSVVIFHHKESSIFSRKYLIFSFKLLIAYFFITVFVTQTNIFRPYAFKTSSYIWTISFLFVGAYILDKVDKRILRLGLPLLVLVYLFSTGNYPNFLIDLFYRISDKFQFIKGSEMAIAYISITLLSYKLFNNERLKFGLLIFLDLYFFQL